MAYAEPLWFKIDPRDMIKAFVKPKSDISVIVPEPVVVAKNLPYDPTGKLDPFRSPFEMEEQKKEEEKELVVLDLPDTELTRWECSQLRLSGTIINHTFKWAAFLTPEGGRCYKGQVGDFIGKEGLKITEINGGQVLAGDGKSFHEYKLPQ